MTDIDFTTDQDKQFLDRKGVYLINVLSYQMSSDLKNYSPSKTQFIKFRVHDTESLKETSLMFWLPKDSDPEKRVSLKRKLLKEFFTSLGCDLKGKKQKELLDDTIGRECKVALREKERVYIGKQDGKPILITELEYYYSGTKDKPLTAKEDKMFLPLTPQMRSDYEKKLAEWENNNNSNPIADAAQSMSQENDTDDLPF